jgi:hypothetical protein
MTALNIDQHLDPDTGEITSTLREKPRVNPPKILHRYGFLESNVLSDVANKNHAAAVDGHASYMTTILDSHQSAVRDNAADTNLSPSGKLAKSRELAKAAKLDLQEITDKHLEGIDYKIGKIKQDIPDDVWKPTSVPEMMDAREIRDHLRGLDPATRLARALAAGRAAHAPTVSAIVNDPIHGGNLLNDGGVASIKDAWRRAAYKSEFSDLDAANEARGIMDSNCKTAIKTLPQTM